MELHVDEMLLAGVRLASEPSDARPNLVPFVPRTSTLLRGHHRRSWGWRRRGRGSALVLFLLLYIPA